MTPTLQITDRDSRDRAHYLLCQLYDEVTRTGNEAQVAERARVVAEVMDSFCGDVKRTVEGGSDLFC